MWRSCANSHRRATLLLVAAALGTIVTGPARAEPFQLPDLYVQLKGGETEADLVAIRDAGFTGVRIGVRWELVERRRGEMDFGYLRATLRALHGTGLSLLVTLRGGNALYGRTIDHYTRSVGRSEALPAAPDSDNERERFIDFATSAVAAARATATTVPITWEIWNEPDLSRFWPPRPDPAALAKLVVETCRALRADGPTVVIGPALGERDSVIGAAPFLSALGRAGALDCLDGFSVHPYWARPPETWTADAAAIRAGLRAASREGRELSIAISEWGMTNVAGAAAEEDRAERLIRAILAAGRSGVRLLSIYEWRDSGTDPSDPQHHFGLVTRDRDEKLALPALRWLLAAAKGGTLTIEQADDPVSWQVAIRAADGSQWRLSWRSGHASALDPAATRCSEASTLAQVLAGGPGPARSVAGQADLGGGLAIERIGGVGSCDRGGTG